MLAYAWGNHETREFNGNAPKGVALLETDGLRHVGLPFETLASVNAAEFSPDGTAYAVA